MIGIVRGGLSLAVCAVLTMAAGSALAAPRHSGFTGDLGLGVGLTGYPVETYTDCSGTFAQCGTIDSRVTKSTEGRFGLAPLSLSLGGFLTPKLALLFRASGTTFLDGDVQYLNAFYGAVVEYWPHERFFLGGGPGVGYFGTNPLQSAVFQESQTGFALAARGGAALIGGQEHDLTLSIEATSGFYAEHTILSSALIIAWKWY